MPGATPEGRSLTEDSRFAAARLEIQLTELGTVATTLEYDGETIEAGSNGTLPIRALSSYYSEVDRLLKVGRVPAAARHHEARRNETTEQIVHFALPNTIRDEIRDLLRVAGQTLFLEIDISNRQLDAVPWELLGGTHLAEEGGAEVVVWRACSASVSHRTWPKRSVLMVEAAPLDAKIAPNARAEFREITRQLDTGDVHAAEPIPLSGAKLDQFLEVLLNQEPDILHMAMHGETTYLSFEDPKEEEDRVSYSHLVDHIGRRNHLSTVVLTACYSACVRSGESAFTRRLAERGIPAAIGMSTLFTPLASREFTRGLYGELSRGRSIVESYAAAVRAVRLMSTFDGSLWGVPVLYASEDVIPLPTDAHLQLLERLGGSVEHIDNFLGRLSEITPHIGPGTDWKLESTGLEMSCARMHRELSMLQSVVPDGRADVHRWRMAVVQACNRTREHLNQVEACLVELGDEHAPALGRARAAARLAERGGWLANALSELRSLIVRRFPIVAVVP
jgi:hypothetical protein